MPRKPKPDHPEGATLHLGGTAYAHPDAQGTLTPTNNLTNHPDNPRRGDQAAITSSIRDLGLYRGIVAQRSTGHVLVGNHTYRGLAELGAEKVPTIFLDVDDVRARVIVARDNDTSDRATYDDTARLALLQRLQKESDANLLLAGSSPGDLELLRLAVDPPLPREFPEYGSDLPTEHRCPSCGYEWSGSTRPGGEAE